MVDARNSVAFIKKLHNLEYTNTQIHLITRWDLSAISRIVNGKTYKDVFIHEYQINNLLEQQKQVLDRILQYREIPGFGHLSDMDRAYIRLIKICGGTYNEMRNIYYDRPISDLRPAWNYANQSDLSIFDSELLGISHEHYEFFIEGVFSNWKNY